MMKIENATCTTDASELYILRSSLTKYAYQGSNYLYFELEVWLT